jgi:double-stranded uracil-DNA glycosylase
MLELPDYLPSGLRIVFVGINPSVYSVEQGHYFARKINRFWPAFSSSRLSAPIREALGRERLFPEDDVVLPKFGIGFTDVVKRPTPNISHLTRDDFQTDAPVLLNRLEQARPLVACFHGLMGYRPFVRYGLGLKVTPNDLGEQELTLGPTRVFVVPSPSPANAHFTPADQVFWFDRLSDFVDDLLNDGRPSS